MLLTEKWKDVLKENELGNIDGISKSDLAMILENTEVEGVKKTLNERTESGDIAQFTPILIPLVRRAFPALLAKHIVGIQALKTPTSYIYALLYKYIGNGKTGLNPTALAQILSLENGVAVGDTLDGVTTTASGEVIYAENDGKTVLVKITNGIKFGVEDIKVNGETDASNKSLAVWSNQAQFQKVLVNYAGEYTTSQAEDLSDDMNEVGFQLDRVMVEAKSMKLKGRYTIEMLQDLKAMHGLDAEKELTELMANEVQWEIDRKVVNLVNNTVDAESDAIIGDYDGRWEIEKYRVLGIKIANISTEVGKLIRKSPANTILASAKTSIALESVGKFLIAPVENNIDTTQAGGNTLVGKLDKKYTVVTDLYNDEEYANVFYKGSNNKDALAFLGVYSGAQFIKTVDPESGQPTLILSTRIGMKENPLNPEKFGRKFSVNFTGTALA